MLSQHDCAVIQRNFFSNKKLDYDGNRVRATRAKVHTRLAEKYEAGQESCESRERLVYKLSQGNEVETPRLTFNPFRPETERARNHATPTSVRLSN